MAHLMCVEPAIECAKPCWRVLKYFVFKLAVNNKRDIEFMFSDVDTENVCGFDCAVHIDLPCECGLHHE